MPQLTRRREPDAHNETGAEGGGYRQATSEAALVAAAIRAGGAITHAAHLFGRPNRRQLTLDAPERMFSSRGEETAVPHLLSRRPDFAPLANRACGAWPVLESQCPRLREILGTRCVSMLLRTLLSDWPLADDRRELRLLQGLDGYCAGALEPYQFQILKDPARQLEVSCIDPLRKAAANWV